MSQRNRIVLAALALSAAFVLAAPPPARAAGLPLWRIPAVDVLERAWTWMARLVPRRPEDAGGAAGEGGGRDQSQRRHDPPREPNASHDPVQEAVVAGSSHCNSPCERISAQGRSFVDQKHPTPQELEDAVLGGLSAKQARAVVLHLLRGCADLQPRAVAVHPAAAPPGEPPRDSPVPPARRLRRADRPRSRRRGPAGPPPRRRPEPQAGGARRADRGRPGRPGRGAADLEGSAPLRGAPRAELGPAPSRSPADGEAGPGRDDPGRPPERSQGRHPGPRGPPLPRLDRAGERPPRGRRAGPGGSRPGVRHRPLPPGPLRRDSSWLASSTCSPRSRRPAAASASPARRSTSWPPSTSGTGTPTSPAGP